MSTLRYKLARALVVAGARLLKGYPVVLVCGTEKQQIAMEVAAAQLGIVFEDHPEPESSCACS